MILIELNSWYFFTSYGALLRKKGVKKGDRYCLVMALD
jgi:hypothetical protein